MIRGRTDTFFTIREVARMAGVARKTVQNWIAEGVIRVVRLGRRRFVPLSSLELALGATPREPVPAEVQRQLAIVRRDVRTKGAADRAASRERVS